MQSDESPTESQSRLNKLVSDINLVCVVGTSDPRYLGPHSGAGFARVAFAAIERGSKSHHSGVRYGDAETVGVNSSDSRREHTGMRESFFGLSTSRERVQPAKWPSRRLANHLIGLYFCHANPQLPILHRVEFEAMVNEAYSTLSAERVLQERGGAGSAPVVGVGARELYMMNIVFAIGAGIFLEKDTGFRSSSGSSDDEMLGIKKNKTRNRESTPTDRGSEEDIVDSGDPISSPHAAKKPRLNSPGGDTTKQEPPSTIDGADEAEDVVANQESPEAYHAAALPHLEAFLSSGTKGGLQELQAVLLLAGYALIKPVPPGLWYIAGVAVRLAIDLGLHFEDSNASSVGGALDAHMDIEAERLKGEKEWNLDLRRRLWWCTYSIDRLVSICVGRPLGIQDEVVSTRVSFRIQFAASRFCSEKLD